MVLCGVLQWGFLPVALTDDELYIYLYHVASVTSETNCMLKIIENLYWINHFWLYNQRRMISWEHLGNTYLLQMMTLVAIDMTHCSGHRNFIEEIPNLLDFGSHWRFDCIPSTALYSLLFFQDSGLHYCRKVCDILSFWPTFTSVLLEI